MSQPLFPFSFQRCVVVQEVYPEGLIAQDGRLQPGDQIIEINGVDMTCSTHGQVSTTAAAAAGTQRLGEGVIKFGSIREEIGLNLAAEAVAVPPFSPGSPSSRTNPPFSALRVAIPLL